MDDLIEEVGRIIKAQNEVIGVKELTEIVTKACNKVLPSKKSKYNKKPVYWWSNRLADTRTDCLRYKRAMTRANRKTKTKRESLKNYTEMLEQPYKRL